MEIINQNDNKEENKKHTIKRVILRFTSLGRNYTVPLDYLWNVKKLHNFLNFAFKENVKNNKILLFYGTRQLNDEEEIFENIFKNKSDMNQIFVVLKSRDDNANNRKNSTASGNYNINTTAGKAEM